METGKKMTPPRVRDPQKIIVTAEFLERHNPEFQLAKQCRASGFFDVDITNGEEVTITGRGPAAGYSWKDGFTEPFYGDVKIALNCLIDGKQKYVLVTGVSLPPVKR
jgi:hypothetical protein